MKNEPSEHIAIIGMACRFPGGASSPDAYWKLLKDGKDAIVNIPKDRWDIRRFFDVNQDKEGKAYVKQGGFLNENLELFDPLFFGISPREAESLDPMQRLLLEVTWEAFEDAGLIADKLKGSRTGVFIGGFCLDNLIARTGTLNLNIMGPNTPASSTMTILSNRISHVFDLWGPSITMDTACSSSLVATHIACQSIWNNESDLAIVGGANAMLRPEIPMMMCKGKFLSDHCRCMAFDEKASGYTRGEGAGIVILKRMSAAVRDNNHIYASIRMTGVNQDGHTPGISLPNPDSQEQLIREVFQRGGIDSSEIDYVEAHGTGTQAGDTAELHALNRVLSEKRRGKKKCYVGSVKTNIGHLEAAAGVAGLMKAALVLKHKEIPPNLHFENPNPKIPFEKYCLKIPTETVNLPKHNRLNLASVNSFGYGGTNAHVVVEAAPEQYSQCKKVECSKSNWPYLIPLSAKSNQALKALAGKYSFFITSQGDKAKIEDIAFTSSMKRSHLDFRMTVLADSNDDLREKLTMFNMGDIIEGVSLGQALTEENPGLVFVFSGMGPQWWGMGRELMEKEPIFYDSLRASDVIFKKIAGWSIVDELRKDELNSRINETQVAQPANFVIQAALNDLWKSRGIKPSAIVGHSVGEVAAAYVSGALSLADALLVSYHRSRLQQTLGGKNGSMLAVSLPEQDALEIISEFPGTVSIAAINSPSAVTLAGDKEILQKISVILDQKEIFNRFLKVELAYHSYQMDSIKKELLDVLSGIAPCKTEIPLYSAVSGERKCGSEWNAEYWWNNVRKPVRFAHAVNNMLNAGYSHFLEIGPHPVLGNSIKECGLKFEKPVKVIQTLNRKTPELPTFQTSLGELFCQGYEIDWESVNSPNGQFIKLPVYPWQREHYWLETQKSREYRLGLSGHVFFNNNFKAPEPIWTVELNDQFFPFLYDHKVESSIVFPGAGYVAASLELHQKYFENHSCILENIEFQSPLVIDVNKIQHLASCFDTASKQFSIYSKIDEDDAEWQRHSSGLIVTNALTESTEQINMEILNKRLEQNYPVDSFCEMLDNRGLHYGKSFQCVKNFRKNNDEFLIDIQTDDSLKQDVDSYLLHPTILDAAFQATLGMIETNHLFIPVNIKRIRFYSSPGQKSLCFGKIIKILPNSFVADIFITDESGNILVVLEQLHCQAITMHQEKSIREYCYEYSWTPAPLHPDMKIENAKKCLVLGSNASTEKSLTQYSKTRNINFVFVSTGGNYSKKDVNHYQIDFNSENDIKKLLTDTKDFNTDTVLFLNSLNNNEPGKLFKATIDSCMQLVDFVREWENFYPGSHLFLRIATCCAQVVKEGDTIEDLSTAPFWGLGQLIENEYPHIKCKLIDLPKREITEPVITELFLENNDNDVAFRSDQRFFRKLVRIPFESEEAAKRQIKLVSTDIPIALDFQTSGKPDSMVYKETERRKPGIKEVEIKIHTVSLRDNDILKAYGKLSNHHDVISDNYGLEVSGTIIDIGKDIKRFKIGDEVVSFTKNGAFSSYITVPEMSVFGKHKSLSLEEAPIYAGFSTAFYALVHMAGLKKDEKVLINCETGEIGLCAVQIAQWIGAEIIATANTTQKREYLQSLGIKQVMDSNSLQFVDEIRNITDGKGVNVVINMLAGDVIRHSLSLLAPYGRFIELGKKNIAANIFLPMSAFNHNLTFASVDFDRMVFEQSELIQQLINEIDSGLTKGYFQSLPLQSFPAGQFSEAFDFMQKDHHIGNVVVKFEAEEVSVLLSEKKEQKIYQDGTYLITGGTRGFGLEVARYLAANGAGHLVLLSRSGVSTEEAEQAISSMKAQGCKVTALAVDITKEQELQKVISDISLDNPPLKGIFHGAMVLDDAMLPDLSRKRFEKVLLPKIAGALNLHEFTQKENLDFFVSFSSISSITGNKGQGNYVAANAFLDSFSHFRRGKGLPASTINWGALGESGVVSRSEGLESLLKAEGINGLSNDSALHGLELTLEQNPVQIGIFDVDWETWSQLNQQAASSSRFQDLVGNLDETPGAHKRRELIDFLLGLDKSNRQQHLETLLCECVSKVLRFSSGSIDPNQALKSLGIDSLTAVELLLVLKMEGGIELSTIDLLKGGTISQLAKNILEKLIPEPKSEKS